MVSVCDIGYRYAREKLLQLVSHAAGGGRDLPDRMAYAVVSHKIVERFASTGVLHYQIYGRVIAICEERRTCVRR